MKLTLTNGDGRRYRNKQWEKDGSIVIVWTKLMGLRQSAASKNGISFRHAQFTAAICGSRYRNAVGLS